MNLTHKSVEDQAKLLAPRPVRGGQIQSLQLMRAIAALAVVAFHTHIILSRPEYGGIGSAISVIAAKGWIGVNFFFVLSGYIISFAHKDDIGKRARIPNYLFKRATRLYPIYWIFLTFYIAVAALGIWHPDFSWNARNLITSYSLLNVIDQPTMPLKVAWTLLFEVKFYLMFGFLIAFPRVGLFAFLTWAAAIILSNLHPPYPDWGYLLPDWGMLSIWNIYFLFGVAGCFISNRIASRWGSALLIAGVCLLFFLLRSLGHDMDIDSRRHGIMIALALAFTLIVTGASLSERSSSWHVPAMALLLGDASYSIYLVHSAVISFLALLNHKLHPAWLPNSILYIVVFMVATVAGVAAHLIVERPLLAKIKRMRTSRIGPQAFQKNALRS